MKKMIVFLMVALLCATMAVQVFAAGQDFVPSITYKDGLLVLDADMNGEDVGDCIVVTSIKEAEAKSTDIHQESRDELLDVYKQLNDGTMTLPLEGDYVVVELVDISLAKSACVEDDAHEHEEWLAKEGNVVTVDLGNSNQTADLTVLSYNDGIWTEIKNVVNNGNGTYECEFEHFCPVAFCVEAGELVQNPAGDATPKTGDSSNVFLWLALMLAAAAALVVTVVSYRRRAVK